VAGFVVGVSRPLKDQSLLERLTNPMKRIEKDAFARDCSLT